MNVSVDISGAPYEDSLFSPDRWTPMVILKMPGAWDEKGIFVIWE